MLGWIGLVVLAGCLIKSIDWGNGTDQWNVSIANVGKFVLVCTYLDITPTLTPYFPSFLPPSHIVRHHHLSDILSPHPFRPTGPSFDIYIK